MADRTVKVKLVADVSEYTAGLARAAFQTRQLGKDVERNFDRSVAPAMRRSGERQGGILARGINSGLVRNSPLIAAGVSAALAAGAPVALAGATTLFAGIGAVAAAQSSRVRESWTDLGHEIRDGAIQDAAVLVPVYEDMANKIGAAFQRMRPEIRDAFEAAAPLIDTFTDSLTQAAENALPGLVRAVERGGPVIEGLGSLMEDIGTGLSDFLDAMSDNSGAAGAALEAIGDALGEALPLLGELLGTGAEIASVVLPPLADALGAVHDIVRVLGPILPAVVTGFLGFKAAQFAATHMQTLAVNAQMAAVAMTGNASAGQRMGSAISGLGRALPGIGLALGAVTAVQARAEEQGRAWAEAIAAGGRAADIARGQMDNFALAMQTSNTGTEGFITGLLGLGSQVYLTEEALEAAEEDLDGMGRAAEYNVEPLGQIETKFSDLRTAADDAKQAVDNYKLSLDILSGDTVSLIQVEASLQAALAESTGAMEGMTGSVLTANGELNLQSEAGRAAADVLLGVRDSGNLLIATMIEQGATTDEVKAKDAELRQSFINSAIQMGISEEAAWALADQILGIPSERETTITADTTSASTNVENLQAQIDGLRGKTVTVKVVTDRAALATYAAQNGMQTVGGYAEGGYTGDGGKYEPKGVVHGGEFVFTKRQTSRAGVGALKALASSLNGYAEGGFVDPSIYVRGDSSDLRGGIQAMTQMMANSLVPLHVPGASTPNGAGGLGPAAARAHQFVRSNWGFAGTIGGYSYRNIAGTNQLSKHALGKAIDVMVYTNKALGDSIANYFAGPGRGPFGVDNVIWYRRIHSGGGWAPYGGVHPHYDHPHIDFYKTGTPYVPHDGMAYLHKGEAVIPAEANRSQEFAGSGASGRGVTAVLAPGALDGMRLTGTLDLGGGLYGFVNGVIQQQGQDSKRNLRSTRGGRG